jgi:hypothetical protein
VVNKAPLLNILIADNDLSLLALTETWIKSDDPQWSKMTQHHLLANIYRPPSSSVFEEFA